MADVTQSVLVDIVGDNRGNAPDDSVLSLTQWLNQSLVLKC